jgi:DNA-binding NtrC family response regulator
MAFYLRLAGAKEAPVWELQQGVNQIGRSPHGEGNAVTFREADISSDYGTISRHHARIEVKGNRVTISKVTQKGHVIVNTTVLRERGLPVDIQVGDHVMLGKVRLQLCEGRPAARDTSQRAKAQAAALAVPDTLPAATAEIEVLRTKHERLQSSIALAQRVLREEDFETALENMLQEVVDAYGLQCGVVVDLDAGGRLRGKAFVGLERIEDLSNLSQRVVRGVLESGKSCAVSDTLNADGVFTGDSIERLGIRSVLCAPLRTGDSSLGVIYLDKRGAKKEGPFTEDDETYLGRLAEILADSLMSLRRREAAELRGMLDRAQLVGSSETMLRVADQIRKAARLVDANPEVPTLILGESGTGKELVARAIHAESNRRDKSYVEVNVGEFRENPQLAQAELFGTIRGAFPEARDRAGAIGSADRGVVFLDEIGHIHPSVQTLLLRFLSDRSYGAYHRLGEDVQRVADVAVVMATNRDLGDLVKRGDFYGDFAERLRAAHVVRLPALADHLEDLTEIVHHYLRLFNQQYRRQVSLSQEALRALAAADWKNRNVRALIGIVRETVAGTDGSHPILVGARRVEEALQERYHDSSQEPDRDSALDVDRPLWEVELDHCLAVWESSGRHWGRAAKKLVVSDNTLKKKIIEGQYKRLGKDLPRLAAFFGKDVDELQREIRTYQVTLSP